MSEIEVCAISSGEEITRARGLLSEDTAEAMLRGVPVTAFIAVINGIGAGALAGVIDDEVFEVTSLFVDPHFRKRGVGRALIETMEELLEDENMAIRIQYTNESKSTDGLFPFLRKMGYEDDPISYPEYYIGHVKDLKADPRFVRRIAGSILPFSEVTTILLKEISADNERRGLPVPEGGLTDERIDRELSLCVVRDRRVVAYVAVEEVDSSLIQIPALWSALENPMETLSMVVKLVFALRECKSPDTRIAMLTTNVKAAKIIDYFFDYTRAISYRMVKY